MDDIRRIEDQTKKELDEASLVFHFPEYLRLCNFKFVLFFRSQQRQKGEVRGMKAED
jgi:hypothetical protein